MNTQLVKSIYQVIQSLSEGERCLRLASQSLLEEKLYTDLPYPSPEEMIALAEVSEVFNFLHDELDIYTLDDGELIK